MRTKPMLPDPAPGALARSFPWLRSDSAARRVSVVPGVHAVRSTLWLPEGYSLVVGAGTTLRFAPDAALVVRGGCEIRGTPDKPVRFEPSGADWPGLAVLGGGKKCEARGLVVRATRGISHDAWVLDAGATFYATELLLQNASFEASSAQNALHLARSRVTLEHVKVSAAKADGLDADRTTGTAQDLICEEVGAACVDASRAELNLHGLNVRQAGVEAVSAGNHSQLTVRALNVRDAGFGLTAKEGSILIVTGASFEQVKGPALRALGGKVAQEPAQLEASNVGMNGVGAPYLLEQGQRLVLEGRELAVNAGAGTGTGTGETAAPR